MDDDMDEIHLYIISMVVHFIVEEARLSFLALLATFEC